MSPPPRGGDMPLGEKKDAAKKCVCAAGCGSVFAGQQQRGAAAIPFGDDPKLQVARDLVGRSDEHTCELQSLMRISYAVFCLKKKITGHHWQATGHTSST